MLIKALGALMGISSIAAKKKSGPLTLGRAGVKVGKFGALAFIGLLNAQVTVLVIELTPFIAHSIGEETSTMEDFKRCSAPAAALGPDARPDAAMARTKYRCELGMDETLQDNDAKREAALQESFVHMDAESVMMLIPKSVTRKWFWEGANAAPSASTPLGAMLAMGSIEAAQAVARSEGRQDFVEEAASAAKVLMRQSYPNLVSQASRADGIDRDISPMIWGMEAVSGKVKDGELFSVINDNLREKILEGFWRTQHPDQAAAAKSNALDKDPSFEKLNALREKSERWAKGIASRDGLHLSWIDKAKDQP